MFHGYGHDALFQMHHAGYAVDGVDGVHHTVDTVLAGHPIHRECFGLRYMLQLFGMGFVGTAAAAASRAVQMPDAAAHGKTGLRTTRFEPGGVYRVHENIQTIPGGKLYVGIY